MTEPTPSGTRCRPRGLRAGLQFKCALALAGVVLLLSLVGEWLYYGTVQDCLRAADRRQAVQTGSALSLAARDALQKNRVQALQNLAKEGLHGPVRFVAVLDSHNSVVAWAESRGHTMSRWEHLMHAPLAEARARQDSQDILTLAGPILSDPQGGPSNTIGAVRLVWDTSSTTENLGSIRRSLTLTAALIVVLGIGMGYLVVWRVVVQPISRLVGVARQLGQGDYAARARLKRADEIGELATAFDAMAGDIARARDDLVEANEMLETKVAQRTLDLQRANDRLRHEMAEKEDFLRAVSHDLNAPLRNIAGMATLTLMKWGQQLPEEVASRLKRIQANVEQESSLIGELLELSRIRTRPEKRQIVDMGELMEELGRLFEYELRRGNITLAIKPPMPRLYVEKTRMRQAFQNLLDNAIKYMDKPVGRIEIAYRLADGMHRFSVTDNGPGVPLDQQQRIFYVFRRVETEATAKVPGKGVGLALVKAVATNHEGRTWVESSPSQGATFHLELSEHCTQEPSSPPADEDSPPEESVNATYHLAGR